ncbi:MAG: hypothetical protein WBD20_24975 [Pirellulaceae bacterium]
MKLPLLLNVALASCFVAVPSQAMAQDSAKASVDKARNVFRGERPDVSRGWVIVSKTSYWPLVYEAMDTFKEAQQLIGKSEPQELADALEKCNAWLSLARSVTDSQDDLGLSAAASVCELAAQDLSEGKDGWDEKKLTDLITFANVAVANSHIDRSSLVDETSERAKKFAVKKNSPQIQSDDVKEAAKEVAKENQLRTKEQFRFDVIDSYRHLKVAQEYLNVAAEVGGIKLDSGITAEIPELAKDADAETMLGYANEEIRPRVKSFRNFASAISKDFRKQFEE